MRWPAASPGPSRVAGRTRSPGACWLRVQPRWPRSPALGAPPGCVSLPTQRAAKQRPAPSSVWDGARAAALAGLPVGLVPAPLRAAALANRPAPAPPGVAGAGQPPARSRATCVAIHAARASAASAPTHSAARQRLASRRRPTCLPGSPSMAAPNLPGLFPGFARGIRCQIRGDGKLCRTWLPVGVVPAAA